jgi:hypothetical protein
MGRKAKHHFIPRSYLKRFTEGGKDSSLFWSVPINNDTPFQTSPKDACSERDYYTFQHTNSLVVEDWYATEIEPKINEALRHIEENSSFPAPEGMSNLILLLATLYLRTPSHRAIIEAPMKHSQEIIASMSEDIKISNCHEFDYTQSDLIMHELRLINFVIELLDNKFYRLYFIKESEFDVITSDDPFILSHPNAKEGFYFGLNTPNIEICVPITRRAILIARNEPFEEGVFLADDRFVGLTNTKLILSASKFFYSSKPEIALVDDNISVCRHDIRANNSVEPINYPAGNS